MEAELLTITSLATFSGSVLATYVVCNSLQTVFSFSPRWLALAIAILIQLMIALRTPGSDYFLALINGCLVFLSAVGANRLSSGTDKETTIVGKSGLGEQTNSAKGRSFLSAW